MSRVRKIRRRKLNSAARDSAQNVATQASYDKKQSESGASRIVIAGSHIFNVKLAKVLEGQEQLAIVAVADSYKDGMAYPNEFGAELVIVDVDFGGKTSGIALARDMNERSPGCAFMIVCGPLTSTVTKHLWVYATDSWSVVSQATAKNPAHLSEAVSSAVHGITWTEPGIRRELSAYGPRPRSLDERKLAAFVMPSLESA